MNKQGIRSYSLIGALIAAAIIVTLSLASCASIVDGGPRDINISSSPNGASVRILDSDGMEVASGKTPLRIPLDRGAGFFQGARYRVMLSMDGFDSKELYIKSTLNTGWYVVGNLLVGGWLGWLIVDPLTGAMWNLKPRSLTAELSAKAASAGPGLGEGLKMVLMDQVDEELMKDAVFVGMLD